MENTVEGLKVGNSSTRMLYVVKFCRETEQIYNELVHMVMKASGSPDLQSASPLEGHWFTTPVQRSTRLSLRRAKVSTQV